VNSKESLPPSGNGLRRLLSGIDREAISAVTLAGLALFILLRFGLVLFYENFGVSPEEVGFDYLRTLAQSLYGMTYLAILMSVLFAALQIGMGIQYALIGLLRLASRSLRGGPIDFAEFRSRFEALRHGGPALARRMMWRALLSGAALAAALFLFLAHAEGQEALRGKGTSPYASSSLLPLFPWEAEPAVVYTLDSNSAARITNGSCYLFLGGADGVTVLYDPREAMTIRLPTGAIELRTGASLVDKCPP
jgi:hypothetical protein